MIRELLLVTAFSFLAITAKSQLNGPSVIAADGGSSRMATLVLDWTLGELSVETVSSSDQLYTQGFHQPKLMVKEMITQPVLANSFVMSIAPNPVQTTLNVSLPLVGKEYYRLSLLDMQGNSVREIMNIRGGGTTLIDLSALSNAVYLLRVQDHSGNHMKTFRIVKIK